MAIEIKELIIKLKVEKSRGEDIQMQKHQKLSDREIKTIVDQCTEKVLRNITKYSER